METMFDVVMESLVKLGYAKKYVDHDLTMYSFLGVSDEIIAAILGLLEGYRLANVVLVPDNENKNNMKGGE